MVDALWIGVVGLANLAASYVNAYLGLLVVGSVVLATAFIWGISGGNLAIWLALGLPAVLGFCLGRLLRRHQEKV